MDKIIIDKLNECFIRIRTDPGTARTLSDYLTFTVKNYKFMPQYKRSKGKWKGQKKLFNLRYNTCHAGLAYRIERWANKKGIECINDQGYGNELSLNEAIEFIESLNIPEEYYPRDYQINYFINAIRQKKSLQLLSTGGGKSLIIYLIIQWILRNHEDFKGILVVPTIALTSQMIGDWKDYGWNDADEYCHRVSAGVEKDTDKPVTVTTWQSMQHQEPQWFRQFNFVIGDEAHEFEAKSLTYIMESLINAEYRIGTTGTIDNTKISKFTLEGLFGPVHKSTTTAELIDEGYLSNIMIKALVLKHPKQARWDITGESYQKEIEYLILNERRNKFIANLAISLKGNTLILYRYIEKHGMILDKMIRDKVGLDRSVYFIHGGTEIEIREEIRKVLEHEDNAILIASVGTFSRGSNIRKLHNLIFAAPAKKRVRVLQSIGRALRLHDTKEKATLFDIADDMRLGDNVNYSLKHFAHRLKTYEEEQFDFKLYKINLKE